MAEFENENEATLDDLLKNEQYVPSREDLLELLTSDEIDEETKDALRKVMAGDIPQVFGGSGTYMAILFVMIIFSIILFFGYKLYKSIKDKEKKREEKKKQKEMKKKK